MANFRIWFLAMRLTCIYIICLLICACGIATPTQGQTADDPISGVWEADWGLAPEHRNPQTPTVVELKWDGKKTVTGAIRTGPLAIMIKKGSFDGNTGALHLEADARKMGIPIHYLIDGTIDKGIVVGTFKHGSTKGDFFMIKRKS